MSKLTEQLRAYGIHNSHDFAQARGSMNRLHTLDRPAPQCRVYREHRIVPRIYYIPAQTGRAYKSACWQVTQGSILTDPNGHWRNHGHKTFDVRGRDEKGPQGIAAIAWASEHFGVPVDGWKREPFGAWMPTEFVDRRLKQLKDWMEAA